MKFLFTVICLSILFTACDDFPPQSSDAQQRQKQELISRQGNAQVGMPAITNFQEKRMLKMIIELRDTEIKTITYVVDMNGKLHKLCDSIGFGFSASTQFTNPMRYDQQGATLPQADPSGLFSPASADGTWVACLNKETKKMSPVYIEPRIIVSPFSLVD
jgi:hypothetical protein